MTVVDLGAAPGSWSQVLRERLGPSSTDRRDRPAADGRDRRACTCIQGDFESDEGLAAIEKALDGAPVDLVVSDMSPNLSGIDVVDQARSIRLAELALDFARTHLQPGGDLVVKVFQGAGLDAFQREVRASFHEDLPAQAQGVTRSQPRTLSSGQGLRRARLRCRFRETSG